VERSVLVQSVLLVRTREAPITSRALPLELLYLRCRIISRDERNNIFVISHTYKGIIQIHSPADVHLLRGLSLQQLSDIWLMA